jgi:hypothetical protein
VRSVLRLLALALLLAFLFSLFRLAMGLRHAKRERERARETEEARGRRVIAEVPLSGMDVVFLTEDEGSFAWAGIEVRKAAIAGARLLVNGTVLRECARPAAVLPPPSPPEDYEGRERWEVALFLEGGGEARIPCGTLREGVSREIAGRAFEAVRQELSRPPTASATSPAIARLPPASRG